VADVLVVSVSSDEEEDADQVRERRVDGLEHLLEDVVLVFLPDNASRDEVSHPEGVE